MDSKRGSRWTGARAALPLTRSLGTQQAGPGDRAAPPACLHIPFFGSGLVGATTYRALLTLPAMAVRIAFLMVAVGPSMGRNGADCRRTPSIAS